MTMYTNVLLRMLHRVVDAAMQSCVDASMNASCSLECVPSTLSKPPSVEVVNPPCSGMEVSRMLGVRNGGSELATI